MIKTCSKCGQLVRQGTKPNPLTVRQQEVLLELIRGLTCKQVALEMGISFSTVRSHLHHIYQKLEVHNSLQAVLVCFVEGWLFESIDS